MAKVYGSIMEPKKTAFGFKKMVKELMGKLGFGNTIASSITMLLFDC